MTHLERDEILRWWQEGAPSDRHRIVEHLAECDRCGALFGEVIDTRPSGETSRGIEEIDRLKLRGYAAYAPGPTEAPVKSRYVASGFRACEKTALDVVRTFRFARHGRPEGLHDVRFFHRLFSWTIEGPLQTKWIAAAAGCAAAVTLVAVLYPPWRTERAIVEPADSSVRGAAIQTLAPSGAVTGSFVFEWTSPVAAARFDVEVVDAGRERIWSAAVEGATRIAAPRELVSRLSTAGRYSWRVTALDERGARLAQSAPQRFWISGTP